MSKTKLELTWIGKNERKKLEPHILLEDSSKLPQPESDRKRYF